MQMIKTNFKKQVDARLRGHDNEWNGHGEKMRLRHDESPSIVILDRVKMSYVILDRVKCPTSSSTE